MRAKTTNSVLAIGFDSFFHIIYTGHRVIVDFRGVFLIFKNEKHFLELSQKFKRDVFKGMGTNVSCNSRPQVERRKKIVLDKKTLSGRQYSHLKMTTA